MQLDSPLSELLNTESIYRLLYYLLAIKELLKTPGWTEKFVDNQGPQHLLD